MTLTQASANVQSGNSSQTRGKGHQRKAERIKDPLTPTRGDETCLTRKCLERRCRECSPLPLPVCVPSVLPPSVNVQAGGAPSRRSPAGRTPGAQSGPSDSVAPQLCSRPWRAFAEALGASVRLTWSQHLPWVEDAHDALTCSATGSSSFGGQLGWTTPKISAGAPPGQLVWLSTCPPVEDIRNPSAGRMGPHPLGKSGPTRRVSSSRRWDSPSPANHPGPPGPPPIPRNALQP